MFRSLTIQPRFAYLAAFAKLAGLRLVPFDKGFAQYAGLRLLTL